MVWLPVFVLVKPKLSVAINVIVYVPVALYACDALAPVALLPSPKVQKNVNESFNGPGMFASVLVLVQVMFVPGAVTPLNGTKFATGGTGMTADRFAEPFAVALYVKVPFGVGTLIVPVLITMFAITQSMTVAPLNVLFVIVQPLMTLLLMFAFTIVLFVTLLYVTVLFTTELLPPIMLPVRLLGS
jgi:hypothetical protein